MPRIMIAGVQSGVGKTTVALGIMEALRRKGLSVQPFKVGPDYIDPGLHLYAAGHKSHNLDSWMGTDEVVRTVFQKNAHTGFSIIEGVMGLYDGAKGTKMEGSSAHIARILETPIILVVNVAGMAQSCIALIKGFKDYDPQLNIQGVILNNAGEYHRSLNNDIQKDLGLMVLGCLPRENMVKMPARHLGLLPAEENAELKKAITAMGDLIEKEIDLHLLIDIAKQVGDIDVDRNSHLAAVPAGERTAIAVARDEAFSFYYQDSLDYLNELGGEIIYFSPLHDNQIPPASGLYLGGGFPEMFLPELSGNHSMKESIQAARQGGMPIYAECGGFMYLTRTIMDFAGRGWAGVGIIPAEVKMSRQLQALGYVEATAGCDSIIAEPGDKLRGHEFHYSTLSGLDNCQAPFSLKGGKGEDFRPDGYVEENLLASYVHLHMRSNPGAASRFLAACRLYKSKQERRT